MYICSNASAKIVVKPNYLTFNRYVTKVHNATKNTQVAFELPPAIHRELVYAH